METVEVKFTLEPTWFNNAPKIKVAINNNILLDTQFEEKLDFKQTVELSEDGSHQLTFTLYDKTNNDTVVKDGVIEKDTLTKINCFQYTKPPGEDYACWLRALHHTNCVYLNEPLVYYDAGHGDGQNYSK